MGIRSNKDKTKNKYLIFGLGRRREQKRLREKRRERKKKKKKRKEKKKEGKEKRRSHVWNCEYLYEYTCLGLYGI